MSHVILRPWDDGDAHQLAAIGNNRKIWLNLRDRFPHPYTLMDAMQWIHQQKTQHPVLNFCIEYNGMVAGSIGAFPKEDVSRRTVELGYFIGEPFWGLGIATKAIGLMMAYIEKNFDAVRVYAEVFEHNKPSMAALRKNDFHLEGIRRRSVFKDGKIMDDYVWVKLIGDTGSKN